MIQTLDVNKNFSSGYAVRQCTIDRDKAVIDGSTAKGLK
jgi:hypothetical protein